MILYVYIFFYDPQPTQLLSFAKQNLMQNTPSSNLLNGQTFINRWGWIKDKEHKKEWNGHNLFDIGTNKYQAKVWLAKSLAN